MPCVENTPSVSSTFIMKLVFWNLFIESHGMMPADNADDDGAPAIDETSGGSDCHQARDHAVDRTDDRRLAVGHLVHQRPDEKAYCRGRVGVEHGRARIVIGEIRIAAIEAVPPQPKRPAPIKATSRLLGGKCSRSARRRGPTTAAATKPDVPAARWMT